MVALVYYTNGFEANFDLLNRLPILRSDDTCTVDTDCDDYPYNLCSSGTCVHKSLFPMRVMEVCGTIVLLVIMALATMAGIGGGGVVVFLIMAMFEFTLKQSIALSGFSICVCSITRYIVNFKQMHPEKKQVVVIDYTLASVMMPTVLAGSFIGVTFNTILPDLLIQVILALLLFFLTI